MNIAVACRAIRSMEIYLGHMFTCRRSASAFATLKRLESFTLGSNTSLQGNFPHLRCASAKPRISPGTPTANPPHMLDNGSLRNMVAFDADGAVSRKSIVYAVSFGGLITIKPPPPMPDENMLTTPMQIVAAIAASTALPPCLSISTPMIEHLSFSLATAPCSAWIRYEGCRMGMLGGWIIDPGRTGWINAAEVITNATKTPQKIPPRNVRPLLLASSPKLPAWGNVAFPVPLNNAVRRSLWRGLPSGPSSGARSASQLYGRSASG